MAGRAKRTSAIDIETLKGLKQIRIAMGSKPLVGLLGVNGAGKSSVLHALACAYSPIGKTNAGQYVFPKFFPKTFLGIWNTTKFSVVSELFDGNGTKTEALEFWKDVDRWQPLYETRPERQVYFIGLDTVVPRIESEEAEAWEMDSEESSTTTQITVLKHMKAIFNRDYSELWSIRSKTTQPVLALQFGTTKYDAFSMGAGEQRVLVLLTKIIEAPRHSLILVDEIDLLLHTRAFDVLIDVIYTLAACKSKELQIIFTTHRESIINKSDKVELRHIHPGFGALPKTLYFEHATADVIERLTGLQTKDFEIFVEDDFAEAIVYRVASDLGLSRFITLGRYGAAKNAFSLAAGYALAGRNLDDLLIILDGDVSVTDDERKAAMNSTITGCDPEFKKKNENSLKCIRQFRLTQGASPEEFIHDCLRNLPDKKKSSQEVIDVALGLNAVINKHDFIDKLVERLGGRDSAMAMSRIIEVASQTKEWESLTSEVR